MCWIPDFSGSGSALSRLAAPATAAVASATRSAVAIRSRGLCEFTFTFLSGAGNRLRAGRHGRRREQSTCRRKSVTSGESRGVRSEKRESGKKAGEKGFEIGRSVREEARRPETPFQHRDPAEGHRLTEPDRVSRLV